MAFAPEGQSQFHRHSGIAGGVVPHKSRGHVVSAVIHPGSGLVVVREGDILLIGDHQFTVRLACGHNDFGQGRLGLAGSGHADCPLPHDSGCIVGQTLNGAAGAVGTNVGHGAGRHLGQSRRQSAVCRLHHRKGTARRPKAAAGCRQFRRRAGQQRPLQNPVCRLGIGLGCSAVQRLAVHQDAGGQGLGPRSVQTGAEACTRQDACREGGHRRLARRPGDRDILDRRVRPGRQRGGKVLGRVKPVGQRGEEFVRLPDGLDGAHRSIPFCRGVPPNG